ncbi:MAG: acyl-CoA dehydrogenase C-terminal domain-containing protein [Gammaproteobacteria bacterium]|nr:acyl-CoA dehydrogenase C-terminal domain-containing protein [Pseudomonadales bacterium]MCP5347272.1 acyl-CoA dehydrogenase C-terminal domain-containing protein [Pseudomonadales bacterium]
MQQYQAPLEDMRFLLHEVFQAETFLTSLPGLEDLSAELLDAILEEVAKISGDLLSPLNQIGDRQGCRFEDGSVTTPTGFRDAYRTFAAGGWGALTGHPDYGGQGMPKLLAVLFEEMLFAANSAFALTPILTSGAALALSLHGSESLKRRFLPNLYSGRWTGTMCLTEAHAGTDLGIMKTRAEPRPDGTYRLTGSKIFITAGEHDLTENIIHFVLARLPDSPASAHGLSLFLVPRTLADESAELTERNGVSCGSIEHKMGIHGSPTCVINFDAATGYLVGEENRGLACMFTMMNYERLSMGLQGIGLADRSYQVARDYARERLQGRGPAGPARPEQVADPIIDHPDVRRMLLTMRANILAGRALALYTAGKLDTVKFSSEETQQQSAARLVELLTPVVKAYCTDRGFQDCVTGQQVLGGHGYVSEWGQEQAVRDARIAQIYEGTNGIQALDLMGRKTVRCKAEYFQVLAAEVREYLAAQETQETLAPYVTSLAEACSALESLTHRIVERAAADPAETGAASYGYMEAMGVFLYGYMWIRILCAAGSETASGTYSSAYRDALFKTGRFYFERLMPRLKSLLEEVSAGAGSLMALQADQF